MSQTAVMNMALDLLEEEPILGPDDDRAAVRWMNRNYAPVRDSLLRSHPWNFAIKRASLPALSDAPTSGWTVSYQLPADCLRVLPMTSSGYMNTASVPYSIEGRKIVTDGTAPIDLVYISKVEDDTQFDAIFVQVLAMTLASRAANWLTGKQSYATALQQQANALLNEARMVDALEGTPADSEQDDWVLGRTTGVVAY